MATLVLPLRDLSVHNGPVRPIDWVGDGDALSTADDDGSYLDVELLANGTDYETFLSYGQGTFDGSAVPEGARIAEAWLRFQNRGDGTFSYIDVAAFAGDFDRGDRPGAIQLERTSTLWVTSENPVENPSAVRYDRDVSDLIGGVITVENLRAGLVNGAVWNDFGGSAVQRISYLALVLVLQYPGPWTDRAEFVPDADGGGQWNPARVASWRRRYKHLQHPVGELASSPDSRTCLWSHAYHMHDPGGVGAFWLGTCATVVDPTDEAALPQFGTEGDYATAGFDYGYSPDTGGSGDAAEFGQTMALFHARPSWAQFHLAPDPSLPDGAVDFEVEAGPNTLVRMDFDLGDPADPGEQVARLYVKAFTVAANGLGSYQGSNDDGTVAVRFGDPQVPGAQISSLFRIDTDGTNLTPGSRYVHGTWANPWLPPPDEFVIDPDAPDRWPVQFVLVSERTAEPDVGAGTSGWSEVTAQVRPVVKWTMRPPPVRFFYDTPQETETAAPRWPLRMRQRTWSLRQRQRTADPWPIRSRQRHW